MKRTTKRAVLGMALSAAAMSLMTAPAGAQQNWPGRPIEIIVPFAPGGSLDITFRAIAPSLSKRLGQQVLVVNKPGGGGSLGMNQVAKATPDGYTLGVASFSFAANPSVIGNLPFDPIKDFEPITMVQRSAMVLVVPPNIPAKNLQEFIAWAKSKPGELNFTSVGVGSSGHMMGELFLAKTGIKMTHVPFTVNPYARLSQDQVQFMVAPIPAAMSWIKDGRLRALAVTSLEPDPSVPDLPPVARTIPGFETFEWPSLVAPAGTPKAIVDRLQKEIAEVMKEPEIQQRMTNLGAQAVANTPEQFAPFIQEQMKIWAEVSRNLSTTREGQP